MIEPEWVAYEVVLAIHEEQLAEHGGLPGIRDQGVLESALARPKNLLAYSPGASLHQLAAAYAVGIGQKQGFFDGNKRTGWVVCAVFLELNGMRVIADQAHRCKSYAANRNRHDYRSKGCFVAEKSHCGTVTHNVIREIPALVGRVEHWRSSP